MSAINNKDNSHNNLSITNTQSCPIKLASLEMDSLGMQP